MDDSRDTGWEKGGIRGLEANLKPWDADRKTRGTGMFPRPRGSFKCYRRSISESKFWRSVPQQADVVAQERGFADEARTCGLNGNSELEGGSGARDTCGNKEDAYVATAAPLIFFF